MAIRFDTLPVNKPSHKDPRRQLIGATSRIMGQQFEDRLNQSFEFYSKAGFAHVEKTPEPMKVIKSLGNGRFEACFQKKAQPDYKGTLKGGRAIVFEAKFTASDRVEQSRVGEMQTEYLDLQDKLGARCYVVIGFKTGNVYRIPWDVWRDMKDHFGHKYVTENDAQQYKIASAWNEKLMLL